MDKEQQDMSDNDKCISARNPDLFSEIDNQTMPYNFGEVCEHGTLKRKCDDCWHEWKESLLRKKIVELDNIANICKKCTDNGTQAMNEQPQPEYCDCTGFHDGSCHQRRNELLDRVACDLNKENVELRKALHILAQELSVWRSMPHRDEVCNSYWSDASNEDKWMIMQGPIVQENEIARCEVEELMRLRENK